MSTTEFLSSLFWAMNSWFVWGYGCPLHCSLVAAICFLLGVVPSTIPWCSSYWKWGLSGCPRLRLPTTNNNSVHCTVCWYSSTISTQIIHKFSFEQVSRSLLNVITFTWKKKKLMKMLKFGVKNKNHLFKIPKSMEIKWASKQIIVTCSNERFNSNLPVGKFLENNYRLF